MNFIPCVTWIPKGAAKTVPHKVQLSEKELDAIIKKTKSELSGESENSDQEENLINANEEQILNPQSSDSNEVVEKSEDVTGNDEKSDDDLSEYEFDKYDDEEGKQDAVLGLANLTVYASNTDDPYVTLKEDREDDDSEKDNFEIKPSDNLLVVGRVNDDASLLEVHVFNEEEESFYVHHDILLPSFPLCLEWLNYEPGESSKGNLVAVGSMEPVIDVWDMDIVDCLEPAFQLGKKAKPKKGKKGYGHHDAVLDISWNPNFPHVLASGSADNTVILWDLENCSVASTLKVFKDKVQTLCWHPFEAQTLLTGATDKRARVFDCRVEKSCLEWDFPGEIERVIWNHFDPFCYLASTDVGTVHYVDCRNPKPIWKLMAHTKEVTGLTLSPQCPGMLITASADKSVKVWDLCGPEGSTGCTAPAFISEMEDYGIGAIHNAVFCPDCPFIMCCGGEKKCNNLRVWHAAENSAVRKRFFTRPLVKAEKVSVGDVPGNSGEGSSAVERPTMSSMETDHAMSAMESMSITKSSVKKKSSKDKIKKKKKKPRFKS
ncbi:periodic tryptophan protein 1 homolog [Ischnura elegans]|uniref:periodic tryptophan protein 1 homolog n=1 Tax=Ischnura elegans TaxID=197161 RepID=UPI001ED88768|nr:periodic tryptophan protein 1 homolog [Ischnura elegans]XP_046382683.1 periodic tryptophan protein 1 homolog [Ischnura elegans]